MSELDIQALAAAIAQSAARTIPIEVALWDMNTIALYFNRSMQFVRKTWACLPSFPKAIRPPGGEGSKSQPLYKAIEVIKWAESYKEKN
jgi:hypothetical protein